MKQAVKTAKGRALSSTMWIKRQINDQFVKKAAQEGYRSRSAYKILEINQKFDIIKKNEAVLDLGSAPGGWCQVAKSLVGKGGKVFAIDKLFMDKIEGVEFFQNELTHDLSLIDAAIMSQTFNSVICDIAPNTMGNKEIDSIRSIDLASLAFCIACKLLRPNGCFVVKILRGSSEEQEFLQQLKKRFNNIKYAKPKSSRKESREIYLIARNL